MALIFNLRTSVLVKVSKVLRQDWLGLLSLLMCVPNLKTTYPVPFDLSRTQMFSMGSGRKTYHQTPDVSRISVGNNTTFRCSLSNADSWGIACRRCSNCIFVLDLTPCFTGLGRSTCKTRREAFKCWELVCLFLEVWRHYPPIFRFGGIWWVSISSDNCLVLNMLQSLSELIMSQFTDVFLYHQASNL